MASQPDAAAAQRILLDSDDFMHPVEGVSNYNESAYYNFLAGGDPPFGGWIRLGNRPNEGYAEMTVSLWLPDGSLGFQFQRAPIADNLSHNAGGARFDVIEPWKEHRVRYSGEVCLMRDPLALSDPSAAFRNNPFAQAEVDIVWRGLSPGWGGEPRVMDAQGNWRSADTVSSDNQFARGHFEQLGMARGYMRVGGRTFEIEQGCSQRDHSWGPRYWQNTGPYQWLLMSFGEDCGLMALRQELEDGQMQMKGFYWEKGQPNREIVCVETETEYREPAAIQHKIKARFWLEGSDQPLEATGEVFTPTPCRNRRNGWVTRITEALTRWEMGSRTGYGIAEYLVHLEKGEVR